MSEPDDALGSDGADEQDAPDEEAPVDAESTFADAMGPLWADDLGKVVLTFGGIYLLYILLGIGSGLPPRGIFATVVQLTFTIGIVAMLALALNLHWGYTGLFNIGIVGFMAVGAYTLFIFSKPPVSEAGASALVGGLNLPFMVGLLAGVVIAGLSGLLAALPALRLRADYLAIVTIALSEILRLTFTSSTFKSFELFGRKLGTGGGRGLLRNFEDPVSAYIVDTGFFTGVVDAFDSTFNAGQYGAAASYEPIVQDLIVSLFILAFVVGFYWLLARTGGSPFGRVLKAIRADEDVARALGKDTGRFKIKSFMLGCALMGLAGIFWVVYGLGQLNPLAYRPQWTFYVWVALIIGGAGSNTGSIMGSALFVAVLFRGPLYLRNVLQNVLEIGDAPATIAPAVGALLSLDVGPLVAYTFSQMNSLRLVLLGVILVWLMKRRPDGMLGHRQEVAASIPLSADHARAGARARAADGGEEE